ncbi:MAG: anthranilate synthase component I, partial [Acidimicrobiales bacterium]
MYRPDRDGFRALARDHTVVPVWREVLGDLITPVAAFQRVVGDGVGFLLESVEHGDRWSRFSFVGRNPRATITARGALITVEGVVPDSMPRDRGILAAAEALLTHYRSPVIAELPPLHGGLVGYLGYDVVREIEHLPATPADAQGLPDAVLSIIGQLAVFDHWRQRVVLIDNVVVPGDCSDDELDDLYDQAIVGLDGLAADGARAMDEPVVDPPPVDDPLPEVDSSMSSSAWDAAVGVAKEHILDGDIFQVVLSQRFDFDLDADPFAVYRV